MFVSKTKLLIRRYLLVVAVLSCAPCVLCETWSAEVSENLEDAEQSLLEEVGSDIPKDVFEDFRTNAIADTEGTFSKFAKDVLEGVQYDGITFSFQCSTSKKLCDEISKRALTKREPLKFSHKGWKLTLKGDGEFSSYSVHDNRGRRRLLRFRGGGGC